MLEKCNYYFKGNKKEKSFVIKGKKQLYYDISLRIIMSRNVSFYIFSYY